MDGKR